MGKSFEENTTTRRCSRVRTSSEESKRGGTGERPSSSLRIQVIQERLDKVQCQNIEMHHLDEVVNEQNFYALEV